MAIRGLYVSYWKRGLRSQKECDETIQRAKDVGVNELLIGIRKSVHVGQHVISFPYFDYYKDTSALKVSAYIALLPLWGAFWDSRIQDYKGVSRDWLMSDRPYQLQVIGDVNWKQMIDPTIPEAREWIYQSVKEVFKTYDCDFTIKQSYYPPWYNACGNGTADDKTKALSELVIGVAKAFREVNQNRLTLEVPNIDRAKDTMYLDYEKLIEDSVVDRLAPIVKDSNLDDFSQKMSAKSYPYIFTYSYGKRLNDFDQKDVLIHSYALMYPQEEKF